MAEKQNPIEFLYWVMGKAEVCHEAGPVVSMADRVAAAAVLAQLEPVTADDILRARRQLEAEESGRTTERVTPERTTAAHVGSGDANARE